MDLARELLLQITEGRLNSREWGDNEVYHLKLLADVGYIEGVSFMNLDHGLVAAPSDPQLTWTGHDFFETIRPKGVWEKIKDVAKEKGVGLTVESITKIGASVVGALLTAQPA
jgi:hypothetical protein